MKFLVDAQLPRSLARHLNDLGHDSIHTLDLPLRNATPDHEIVRVADSEDRIVVSKDKDFRDTHLLRRDPHRLLMVSTGNIANSDMVALFDEHLEAIASAFDDADFIELTASELVAHLRDAE